MSDQVRIKHDENPKWAGMGVYFEDITRWQHALMHRVQFESEKAERTRHMTVRALKRKGTRIDVEIGPYTKPLEFTSHSRSPFPKTNFNNNFSSNLQTM